MGPHMQQQRSFNTDLSRSQLFQTLLESVLLCHVGMVADIGGTNVDDATRRMMKYILSNELALDYNMFGRHGKNKFKDLCLFNVVYEALKKNSLVNQQEAERALSKWLIGARDRGGRRASRQPVPN
ncbi:hypothetical protein PFLUV_G00021610 [Perca fluviatilis]|uniref:DUF4806 domain-containing protein n=1 Tax=Perca fluviatilis TaxID=8168 RepID=A0A6A5EW52_PERFL|nr:hypothetical protein PFLUV_G00021610 [Perca fluviatilis]